MKKFLLLASLLIVTQATFAEETMSTKEVTPVVQTQVADITFDVSGQELTVEEKEKVEGGEVVGAVIGAVIGGGMEAAKQIAVDGKITDKGAIVTQTIVGGGMGLLGVPVGTPAKEAAKAVINNMVTKTDVIAKVAEVVFTVPKTEVKTTGTNSSNCMIPTQPSVKTESSKPKKK